jgi:penicillin V acylase-like amidase (Ntn superfamily)
MNHLIDFTDSEIAALKKLGPNFHFGCTSLIYQDANDAVYLGRTLELTMDLPYQLAYFPAGQHFASKLGDHPSLNYTTRHALLAIMMPDRVPTAESPITVADLKIIEGLNLAGLTFSLLAYPTAGGASKQVEMTQAVLSATDLGMWTLGQFSSVAEVKAALEVQPICLDSLALLGGVQAPFHYVLHDRSGASIVIEFDQGKLTIYDNPVGVMTNGPQFSWHLTNLSNYTFLSNVDQSSATFGKLKVRQPDSGIATANLPSSSTSVGRFVRAVFYSQFAEKVSEPDQAVRALAHIMNNFDRPKGITVSLRSEGGSMEVEGMDGGDSPTATEYTSWTNLTDLNRGLFFLRTYDGLNYTVFDLAKLAQTDAVKIQKLSKLDGMATDGTANLLAG